jgi:crotonobetainyl-CoA:carnitine CoA-transferase CaiB-like acyl-CoA transferase
MRTVNVSLGLAVGVSRGNRSTRYAAAWLEQIGVDVVDPGAAAGEVGIIAGGEPVAPDRPTVTLWDFQVGRAGTGYLASAASGVSWVIGLPGQPPLALGGEIPEKWCGLLGATMALATLLADGSRRRQPIHVDVSAAEILRSFADQNSGNHDEIAAGWRRNGRLAVEHGGIYPQGFYPCADGYVGVVARSRKDWHAILTAIGNPPWSRAEQMRDPFALSADDSVVEPLFRAELLKLERDALLERAIECGATIAPVYDIDEIATRDLVRRDIDFGGPMPLPFEFIPW